MADESRFDRVSPSGLPTLEQCPRAYAIQRDYDAAREAHPDLPEDRRNYKMVFGSIAHKVVELNKTTSKEVHEITQDIVGEEGKLEFDSAYTSVLDLARGVFNAVKAFFDSTDSFPWKHQSKGHSTYKERKLEAEVEGMKVSGIVDCIHDGWIIDLKTTTPSNRTWYGSQLGAYWLLAKENYPQGIGEHHIYPDAKIVKLYRPRQPDSGSGVKSEIISAEKNEPHIRQLLRTAKVIRDRQDEWRKNYRMLAMNPNSGRCGYCPARGTSACPETRIW